MPTFHRHPTYRDVDMTVMQRWLADLSSGNFAQAQHQCATTTYGVNPTTGDMTTTPTAFCCLGLLQARNPQRGINFFANNGTPPGDFYKAIGLSDHFENGWRIRTHAGIAALTVEASSWIHVFQSAPVYLTNANDSLGLNFRAIANIVEAEISEQYED